jgi:hypothetical protein
MFIAQRALGNSHSVGVPSKLCSNPFLSGHICYKLFLTSHSSGVRDLSTHQYYKHRIPPEWRVLQESLSLSDVTSAVHHCPNLFDVPQVHIVFQLF